MNWPVAAMIVTLLGVIVVLLSAFLLKDHTAQKAQSDMPARLEAALSSREKAFEIQVKAFSAIIENMAGRIANDRWHQLGVMTNSEGKQVSRIPEPVESEPVQNNPYAEGDPDEELMVEVGDEVRPFARGVLKQEWDKGNQIATVGEA